MPELPKNGIVEHGNLTGVYTEELLTNKHHTERFGDGCKSEARADVFP